jgi:hypothetical protein
VHAQAVDLGLDDLEKQPVQALDERNDFKIDALHGPILPGHEIQPEGYQSLG